MKEKMRKNKFTLSHTTKKLFFGKQKKPQPSYFGKQLNFFVPCHPKTQPLRIVSIPKNKIISPNPTPKTLLEKGEIILSSSKRLFSTMFITYFGLTLHEL
jgi:hypothetical protein